MSTMSVPLPSHMEEFIKDQVKQGKSANKADVVRRALRLLEEEEAVQAVLRAETEPSLKGDLRSLSKRIK